MATLTLTLSDETKDMIKSDAKALNMNPSGYVTMVCRSINEEARSEGMQEFVHAITQSALNALNDGTEKKQ